MPAPRDLALLTSRLVLGGYLAAHGAQKLFGSFDGHGIEATSAGFDRLGLRPGGLFARVAGLSELGGGALVAVGAAEPVGPVVLAGTMAVASSTHFDNGPFSTKAGYELPLTNLATALALCVSGPGSISFDRVTGFRVPKSLRRVVVGGAVTSSAVSLAMVLRARRARRTTADAVEAEPEDHAGDRSHAGESPGDA
jgi:putative oxidoreductase